MPDSRQEMLQFQFIEQWEVQPNKRCHSEPVLKLA